MISAFCIFDKAASTVKFRHLQTILIFSILILTSIIIIFFTYQANDSKWLCKPWTQYVVLCDSSLPNLVRIVAF